jgi:hypothetical protein
MDKIAKINYESRLVEWLTKFDGDIESSVANYLDLLLISLTPIDIIDKKTIKAAQEAVKNNKAWTAETIDDFDNLKEILEMKV